MAARDGADGEVGYRRGRWWSESYIDRADGEVGYRMGRLSEADIADCIRRNLKDVGVLRIPLEPETNPAPIERRLWSTLISPQRPDSSSERSMPPEIHPEGRVNQIRHRMSRLHLDREEDEAGSAQQVER